MIKIAQLDEDFVFQVLEVVAEIPVGKVATYGQIAALIGRDKNARLVGKALQVSGYYAEGYPCYRVVNSAGRTVPGWDEQEALLRADGVLFKDNGCVDLKKCKWEEV